MTADTSHVVPASAPPAGGRGRRAAMTWGVYGIYNVITLLVGFFTTPILLRLLSAERIGASRAATEWLGYLLLADLGLGAAFGVFLLRARRENPQQVAAVVRQAMRLLFWISLVLLPVGLLMAWGMPNLVKVDPSINRELQVAALILASGLIFLPLSIFRTVLETGQQGYLVNAALLVQSLLITGLSLLLAWMGWGLIGLSVATLAGGVLFAGMMLGWAMKSLQGFRAAAGAHIPARQILRVSWPLAVAGAGNRLNLMTDSVVIGFILGAPAVAILILTQRVILLASAQITSIANATWPALTELLGTGQQRVFQTRLAELTRLVVGVGTVLVGTVAAYDAQFVRLWVGADLYGGDMLAAVTVASSVVFGFLCVFSWVIDMQGDTRQRLLVSSIGSVLNLGLSVIFVRLVGLWGVALGTLCAYLLTDAWYCPTLVCRRYGASARLILTAAARGLAVGVPWAVGAWLLARSHTPPMRWIGFGVECALVGAAALAYCWWMILTPAERREWHHRLRHRHTAG